MIRKLALAGLILALSAISSHADVLLNFQDLSNNQDVPLNYGSTTDLTVLFKKSDAPGSPGPRASNFGTPLDFGVVELGATFPNFPSEIIFTPAPGFEVSLASFMHSRSSNTFNNASFRLLDINNVEVYSLDVNNNPLNKVLASVNSNFYSSPIRFQYGSNTSGFTRVDDIFLEVRAIPEPSLFSMLLGVTVATVLFSRPTRGSRLVLPRGH